MNRIILLLQLCILPMQIFAQTGQLSISRIDMMPDLPTPLQIRDWNSVAHDYDSFVFDTDKTGQYLPLLRLGTQGDFNYSDNIPIFLDSYVGAVDHLYQAEAINIIPAIVGASLVGIDKSNQDGLNWVAMTKDFFNLENGQNVYLNSYSTTSGNDWWYDVMPNVYFYQLRSLYPDAAAEFSSQFTSVANRWLYCVNKLGGSATPWAVPNMDYRAFDLATGEPLNTGVSEPESAGSISWLLYNAYLETGSRKYFEGAQQAMDFLEGFASNPSYELQLSYGTLTAAHMNAVEGTDYSVQKFLDWCFDRGELRGWGSIVGTWGGYDVSGLIGEANDEGNDYAFIMNSFQQVAALAPLPKYDKRYARAIAKWLLNVTNASRLFYWNSLPETNQDSYAWASVNDPTACIPHESMKELLLGKTPYATGDAVGGSWSATNLSLYSGSGVGYLAAVVTTTNIPEILQIDLNATDFYGENTFPSYLYYNPTTTEEQVSITLPTGTFRVYDAITETVINQAASGTLTLAVPDGEVRMIRLFSSGIIPESRDGRLYAGDDVLDYHYQYSYTDSLRVKALSTDNRTILVNSSFTAYCEPGNINSGDLLQFEWFLNDVPVNDQNLTQATLTAPATPTGLIVKCRITSNGQTAEDTLHVNVVDRIPENPVVNGIESATAYTAIGATNTFTALVVPAADEILDYSWSVTTGTITQTNGSSVTWQAPETSSVGTIEVKVTNQDNLSTTVSSAILVKDTLMAEENPLIWYPFDTDSRNAAADRFHATVSGATKTADARGSSSMAYRFTSGQNIIYTENNDDLNFSNAVSLSCWVNCEMLGSERFIISHGSWQQRYKLSITSEGKIRWTVKTSIGVSDLDSSDPIELNRYYHVTALYTGYSMELYIDGTLDTFKAFTGAILTSTRPLTIGRMDDIETLYALRGSVDEVKLWDKEIPVSQIAKLINLWATPSGIDETGLSSCVYPNPATDIVYINFTKAIQVKQVSLYAMDGSKICDCEAISNDYRLETKFSRQSPGIYFLRVIFKDGNTISKKVILR